MPDEWATELANAVCYETLSGMLPASQPAPHDRAIARAGVAP